MKQEYANPYAIQLKLNSRTYSKEELFGLGEKLRERLSLAVRGNGIKIFGDKREKLERYDITGTKRQSGNNMSVPIDGRLKLNGDKSILLEFSGDAFKKKENELVPARKIILDFIKEQK